jgi:hypothetical protein
MFATLTANVEHDRDAPMHEAHGKGEHASQKHGDGCVYVIHVPQNCFRTECMGVPQHAGDVLQCGGDAWRVAGWKSVIDQSENGATLTDQRSGNTLRLSRLVRTYEVLKRHAPLASHAA